jgi:HAD superfamily hydrolase (TIGR01548 family)
MKTKRNGRAFPLDVLVFDMDGVLIDVSKSYRKTIEKTVHLYLTACLGFKQGKRELALDEAISLFKAAGGFNNDWDLTSGLLFYLLSVSGLRTSSKRKEFSSIPEVVAHLRGESSGHSCKIPVSIDLQGLSSFLKRVRGAGGGLQGVRQALQGSWEGWVYGSGDLSRQNLVKRIFQEVYLGEMFSPCYPLDPLFHQGRGYYLRERMIIPRHLLRTLWKSLHLAIASGRPRFEAELALERFRLFPYFESIVTLDECLEEERRLSRSTGRHLKRTKPHPFPLIKAIEGIGLTRPRCGYVGDVVDDMVAARRAGRRFQVIAMGFLTAPDRDKTEETNLRDAGADYIVKDPNELLRFGMPSRNDSHPDRLP